MVSRFLVLIFPRSQDSLRTRGTRFKKLPVDHGHWQIAGCASIRGRVIVPIGDVPYVAASGIERPADHVNRERVSALLHAARDSEDRCVDQALIGWAGVPMIDRRLQRD